MMSAGAASTSAVISVSPDGSSLKNFNTSSTPVDHRGYGFRERVIRDDNEVRVGYSEQKKYLDD